MQIKVRYFALFREQAGCESESVDWPGGNLSSLFDLMAETHPQLQRQSAALVAVNDEMSDWAASVKEGDEILFFPPVAGG